MCPLSVNILFMIFTPTETTTSSKLLTFEPSCWVQMPLQFFFFNINKESGPNTWNTFCYLLYNLKPEPLMPCQDKPQRRKAPSAWKELWHLSEPRGKLQHRLSTGKEASGPSGDEDALRSRYRNITSDSAQGAGVTSFKTQFPECMW